MTARKKQAVRVHIRWMIRRDVPEALDIEAASSEFPWLEEDFIRCLRQRNCIGMVAEHDDRIVGFMIYEFRANGFRAVCVLRDHYEDTAEDAYMLEFRYSSSGYTPVKSTCNSR